MSSQRRYIQASVKRLPTHRADLNRDLGAPYQVDKGARIQAAFTVADEVYAFRAIPAGYFADLLAKLLRMVSHSRALAGTGGQRGSATTQFHEFHRQAGFVLNRFDIAAIRERVGAAGKTWDEDDRTRDFELKHCPIDLDRPYHATDRARAERHVGVGGVDMDGEFVGGGGAWRAGEVHLVDIDREPLHPPDAVIPHRFADQLAVEIDFIDLWAQLVRNAVAVAITHGRALGIDIVSGEKNGRLP